jgi:hypothetical protein
MCGSLKTSRPSWPKRDRRRNRRARRARHRSPTWVFPKLGNPESSTPQGSPSRWAVFALTFDRQGPGFQGLNAAVHELAAPKAHGVFANPKGLGKVRVRPTPKRQENGSRPIRLSTVRSHRFRFQRRYLLLRRTNWRFTRHAPSPESPRRTESQTPTVGQTSQTCLASKGGIAARDRFAKMLESLNPTPAQS